MYLRINGAKMHHCTKKTPCLWHGVEVFMKIYPGSADLFLEYFFSVHI